MCGWCYGASSLIGQLDQIKGIHLQLHPGGMMQRTPISEDFRQHILASDQRIAELTGQVFGEDYLKKVAAGDPLILDSYITAQAIMATQHLGYSAVDMLEKIQRAHYQSGLPVSQPETLAELAGQLDIEVQAWSAAMDEAESKVEAEIQRTRNMMQRFNLGGFPSMLIEENGQWRNVTVSHFYRQPEQWRAFWEGMLEPGQSPA
nr:DsbA family protein [Marinobacter halodurans]